MILFIEEIAMSWIGLSIRKLRNQMGWCRSDLARRLGVPCEKIQLLETDKVAPTELELNMLDEVYFVAQKSAEDAKIRVLAEVEMRERRLSSIAAKDLDFEQ